MEGRLLVRLVVGISLGVVSMADPQARYQLRSPLQLNAQARNLVPNRFSPRKAGRYPPVPPGTGGQLPGDSRNFIPNRFDIPASIIDKKPGSSVGCVGASPCGLVAPYSPPALPIPPPPGPVAYGGFPPAPVPYGPQGFAQPPAMGTDGFGMHSINSLAQGAAEVKIKLLGGIHPPKKFVPHIPPMGRSQPGKPAYIPPPPLPKPQAAGYAQAGHLPYQKPFGYGQQGMAPPQAPGFVPQPQGMVPPQTPGFAPQPAAAIPQPGVPPMQADFADPQAFTAPEPLPQQPSPLGPPQQDVPQTINSNAPQVPFPPAMNQAPAFNDPGQQVAPDGSFDLAKKRMMALNFKSQMKKFGVPRPVLKSRLVPKPLFKRHI